MMRLIAISNQKGGSGKTTTAVNLAAALAESDRRVLVVDLDPQASASAWLGIDDGGSGLLDVFIREGELIDLVRQSSAPGVDVIPSSPRLWGLDRALAGPETFLKGHLDRLPAQWNYVLMDCPASLGVLTINALSSAREVLVTVEAHVLGLHGLARILQTVDVVRRRLNPNLEVAGILACRVDARTRHALEVVGNLRTRFAAQVYKAEIRENVRLAECPSFRRPITQYDSTSRGADDYRALALEVIGQERS